MTKSLFIGVLFATLAATAAPKDQDLLVKFAPGKIQQMQTLGISFANSLAIPGAKAEVISENWMHVQIPAHKTTFAMETLKADPSIELVQPNYKIHLYENYRIEDPLQRAAITRRLHHMGYTAKAALPDNPAIPDAPSQATGADPLVGNQWGMIDLGVKDAWKHGMGTPDMIVAVIDTGVDYTHEDLAPNLWRNPKETLNGLDDDANGYVDDIIGWDFASNDNKPYDFAVTDPYQLLTGEANPGHGTHCSGNVAAKANNNMGIAGVAPGVRIMALRFITEKGAGSTADAVKAIKYAVDNGAKVLSNSWGSEGDDPSDATGNQALKDAITYAQDHGVLFIAAAGNGHKGVGYDNDTDPKPGVPASYEMDNIISVAAVDKSDNLGGFSNWGAKTVDIAAPGVDVFSTTVGDNYADKVIDLPDLGITATWDGTSMATPHVAGAAALYWSAYPTKTWQEVKAAILGSAKKIPAMAGKSVSQGKLDVKALLEY